MDNTLVQNDFSGGMNLFSSDTNIGATEYVVGFNCRNRTGDLSPIPASVKDNAAPSGLKQGLYAFDVYLILFCAGRAYYKNIHDEETAWTLIADFAMNTEVARIYAEAVPQSSKNNKRQLAAATQIAGTQLVNPVNTTPELIPGSLGGLVCQDGVSQPWFINSDGTARLTKTYLQWTLTDREYVPIMKQMKFTNGILFGIAQDGKTIYRSVSGRPLDFVVNVTTSGDKGGMADTTSYAVTPFEITCLNALNSGELFVGTAKTCHPIEFDYQNTIFAEPTFLNRRSFSAGVTNNFSFLDILSDYTFIDKDGLRSYNAIQNLQNEGRNSVFSAKLYRALIGIKQDAATTAAIVFDNLSYFAINSVYGYVVAVYDNIRQVWVSFDILSVDGPIKQFAVADQSDDPTLYAITENSVYKLYSGAATLTATVHTKALNSERSSVRLQCQRLWGTFDEGTFEGEATASIKVDNQAAVNVSQRLSTGNSTDPLVFPFQGKGKQGWKIQPVFSWNNDSTLKNCEMQSNPITSVTPISQAGRIYNR